MRLVYFKKKFIESFKIKGSLFLFIVFIGFFYSSPKLRMLIADSFSSSAEYLYGTVETKNKDKFYSEPAFISTLRNRLTELFRGNAPRL